MIYIFINYEFPLVWFVNLILIHSRFNSIQLQFTKIDAVEFFCSLWRTRNFHCSNLNVRLMIVQSSDDSETSLSTSKWNYSQLWHALVLHNNLFYIHKPNTGCATVFKIKSYYPLGMNRIAIKICNEPMITH